MFTKFFLLVLCTFSVRPPLKCRLNSRTHFGEPLPVILRNGRILEPDDKYGNVELNYGDSLTLSCLSSHLLHPQAKNQRSTADIFCTGETSFKNDEWLNSPAEFQFFSCNYSPDFISVKTNRTCYQRHAIIEVGYRIENNFYPLYESCFDATRLRAVYTKYTQKPYNAMYQTRVARIFFIDDTDYFGSIPVIHLYSPWNQKSAVARLIGPVVDRYFTSGQELSRGHLAAKTDFVFAFGERASFHYLNCASQWTGFNGGNWNTLEIDLRNYIHTVGYDTIIYTGTYGVMELKSDSNRPVEIYLANNKDNYLVIPVPLYFYKVVYEPTTQRGIVFIGINNPHYNRSEAEKLFFCDDICRKNNFRWLTWHPDNPDEGISFCCTIPDFRSIVGHLPEFVVKGLLI